MKRAFILGTIALAPAGALCFVAGGGGVSHLHPKGPLTDGVVIAAAQHERIDHEWAWPEKANLINADEYVVREGEAVFFESDTVIWATGGIRIDGTVATVDGVDGHDAPNLWLVTGPNGSVEINGTIYLGNGGDAFEIGLPGGDGATLTIFSPMTLVAGEIESLFAGNGGIGGAGADGGNGGSIRVAGAIGRPPIQGGRVAKDDAELWVRAGSGAMGGESALSVNLPELNRPGDGGDGGDALGAPWESVAEWLGYPNAARGLGPGAGGVPGSPGDPCQPGGAGGAGNNFVGGPGANGTDGSDSVVVYDQQGNIVLAIPAANGSNAGDGGSGAGTSGGVGGTGGECCPRGSGPGGKGGKGGNGGNAYAGDGGRGGNGGRNLHPGVFASGGNGGHGGNGGNSTGGNGGDGGAGGNSDDAPGDGGDKGTGGGASFGAGGKGGLGRDGGNVGWDGADGFSVVGNDGSEGAKGGPCPAVQP